MKSERIVTVVGLLVMGCAATPGAVHATTLFEDTFQNSATDLLPFSSPPFAQIVAAPNGGDALNFTQTGIGGELATTTGFNSSTGSFTVSFQFETVCPATSNCGAFVRAPDLSPPDARTPISDGWILADVPNYAMAVDPIKTFPDSPSWEQVSYTFSGSSMSSLGLEEWGQAPIDTRGFPMYFRNLVLTDNSAGLPIGTLTVTPVPEASTVTMFGIGLAFMGLIMRRRSGKGSSALPSPVGV
jgi:PEP-CTERM motif